MYRLRLSRKIVLLLLALLVLLGGTQYFLLEHYFSSTADEAAQRLHWEAAEIAAQHLEPLLQEPVPDRRLWEKLFELRQLNPYIELYVVDGTGEPRAFLPSPGAQRIKRIDPAILEDFLAHSLSRKLPLYIDSPLGQQQPLPFSVARVSIGAEQGYVLALIRGHEFRADLAAVQEFAGILGGIAITLLVVSVTAALGVLFFFLLTKRFYRLTSVVHRFAAGDLRSRAPISGGDEIATLGEEFNAMADTIQQTIEKLEKTDSLRRELIANISHDLGGPIALISGYLETILLRETTWTKDQVRKYVQVALQNVEMLTRMVSELLELSKLEAEEVQPAIRTFSLADLIGEGVLAKYGAQADSCGVALSAELPTDIPDVCADLGMIERVLSNLVENALHYTSAGGTVRILLEQLPESARVSISDSGIGIPADEIPHIFDRYYRAHRHLPNIKGTGLGLAIVQRILQAHRTEIQVRSAVNIGTTFSFELPLAG